MMIQITEKTANGIDLNDGKTFVSFADYKLVNIPMVSVSINHKMGRPFKSIDEAISIYKKSSIKSLLEVAKSELYK